MRCAVIFLFLFFNFSFLTVQRRSMIARQKYGYLVCITFHCVSKYNVFRLYLSHFIFLPSTYPSHQFYIYFFERCLAFIFRVYGSSIFITDLFFLSFRLFFFLLFVFFLYKLKWGSNVCSMCTNIKWNFK